MIRSMRLAVMLVLAGCGAGDSKATRIEATLSPEAIARLTGTSETVPAIRGGAEASANTLDQAKPARAAAARSPITLRVGGEAIEITFKADALGSVKALVDVESGAELATPALRNAGVGRGNDLVLVDYEQREKAAYALFANVTHGSPECGSYGFWALRLDGKGAGMTPALEGCFLSPEENMVDWSSPPVLRVRSPHYQPGTQVEVFALDEAAMVFRSRVKAKASN